MPGLRILVTPTAKSPYSVAATACASIGTPPRAPRFSWNAIAPSMGSTFTRQKRWRNGPVARAAHNWPGKSARVKHAARQPSVPSRLRGIEACQWLTVHWKQCGAPAGARACVRGAYLRDAPAEKGHGTHTRKRSVVLNRLRFLPWQREVAQRVSLLLGLLPASLLLPEEPFGTASERPRSRQGRVRQWWECTVAHSRMCSGHAAPLASKRAGQAVIKGATRTRQGRRCRIVTALRRWRPGRPVAAMHRRHGGIGVPCACCCHPWRWRRKPQGAAKANAWPDSASD